MLFRSGRQRRLGDAAHADDVGSLPLDPRAHPAIAPNYLSTDEDRRIAAQALRLTRRLVTESRAMQRHTPEEFLPGAHHISDEALIRAAGDVGTTIFHPVGSCKMGPDSDAQSVVTPQLREGDRDMTLSPWVDLDDFNPGYITRGVHLLPKQGDRLPWRHTQDYWSEKDQMPVADLDDGSLVMSIASGADPLFNGAFTGIKCDRDGSLMYTTILGLVRFDVAKMEQVGSPDLQMRKN